MRIDLRYALTEGVNNLLTWRNRYSLSDYPEKVVINIFYRKYTVEFMFHDILRCFENQGNPLWNNLTDGLKKLKDTYGNIAGSKTQPILLSLLSNSQNRVGNTSFTTFESLTVAAKGGDPSRLEEIEYAYLYYLLTDECVLVWAALGGTGQTKIDSIAKMSGVVLKAEEIRTYAAIEQILGQFCAAAYLKDNYKPLPPNVK